MTRLVHDIVWGSVQGVLGHTMNPVRQLFERIASPSAADDAEMRFQHFKKHVWLRIKESGSSGQCCNFCCTACGSHSSSSCVTMRISQNNLTNVHLVRAVPNKPTLLHHIFHLVSDVCIACVVPWTAGCVLTAWS